MVTNLGAATAYSVGRTHLPLPTVVPPPSGRATERALARRRTASIDWDALTPSCALCRKPSGQLNANDICPPCLGVTPQAHQTAVPAPRKGKPAAGTATTNRRGTLGGRGGSNGKLIAHTNAIITAYTAGDSCADLAKTYDASEAGIRNLLKRHNVTMRNRADSNIGRHERGPRTDAATQADVVRRYVDAMESINAIAEATGMARGTVRRILGHHNVTSRPAHRPRTTTSTGATTK